MVKVYTLIGMSIDDANSIVNSFGYHIRPVIQNGKDLEITCDYRSDRINVELETEFNNSKIISILGIF